jgi:SpoVK/Ycf46/Vps4 family AAA+-type ATPase
VAIFFDEANALFGKHNGVKAAHDRYANIKIGYLLYRIEKYSGIVILASNMCQNMVEAFIRGFDSRVDFSMPNKA